MNQATTPSIDQQIESMAKAMGVSAADVRCFASSITNSMVKDGLGTEHANSETVEAYAMEANRKMKRFVEAFLTTPALQKNVGESVYELAK